LPRAPPAPRAARPRASAIDRKHVAKAAARLVRAAGGPLDVAIILGSGLAEAFVGCVDGRDLAYRKLRAAAPGVAGHPGFVRAGTWGTRRVAAFAGRVHLYEDRTPAEVTYAVRVAAAAGARMLIVTNAAGALDPSFVRGDVMAIADHINLTGAHATVAPDKTPFVVTAGAYAPHLRETLRRRAAAGGVVLPREGVYVGVRGPHFETAAEAEALRRLGGHAVGMSTVLETSAARELGLEVLGLSLITNASGAADGGHHDVLATSRDGSSRLAQLAGLMLDA